MVLLREPEPLSGGELAHGGDAAYDGEAGYDGGAEEGICEAWSVGIGTKRDGRRGGMFTAEVGGREAGAE